MFPNRLQTVLATLEISDDATRSVRNRVKLFPGNRLDAEKYIQELEEERKIANCAICGGEPFCSLFVACAYDVLGRGELVKSQIEEAKECFQKHGLHWNEALSTWLLGVFDKATYPILGNYKLEKAIDLFEKINIELESEGEYDQLYLCRQLIDKIKIDISIGDNQRFVDGKDPTPKPNNGGGGSGRAAGKLKSSIGKTTGVPSSRPISSEEEALFFQLLQMCNGDRDMAERLIDYDRSLWPHAEHKDLIQRAIDRWLRDNR